MENSLLYTPEPESIEMAQGGKIEKLNKKMVFKNEYYEMIIWGLYFQRIKITFFVHPFAYYVITYNQLKNLDKMPNLLQSLLSCIS